MQTHTSITFAAAAATNLDAAIPLRYADADLQSTIELRTGAPQIAAAWQLQKRISRPKRKNEDFAALLKSCQSIVCNFHATITMRLTTLRCKAQ